MAVELLERDPFLRTLDEALCQAAAGHGQMALISGEAGIGKTSLVERFLERHQPAVRTLWGACEALFTPRPLGPLYDIAQQTPAPLRALLDGEANRATLFGAVLDDLAQGPAPTVVVVEDIHWADEATLDLVKFLSRRIRRIPALLIVTYRDEELGRDHPLRLVLGDLPARAVTRLRLLPLSEQAVATLAEQAVRPARDLHLATGGNPFFLSEVLASDTTGVPTSISDAVLAQVARRSQEAQRLLELVAVVPNRMEWWVIEAVSPERSAALEECLATGILHLDGQAVSYRHELARQAVEDALAHRQRRALHAEVLHALLERGTEQTPLARLVHHAAQAEDGEEVLRLAPEAAKQASVQGAHREATAHYVTALRHADSIDVEQRAVLLDGLANEHYLTGHHEYAIKPCEQALAIWRALDRTEKVGYNLRRLSRLHWFLSRSEEAARYGLAAVELLETLPAGHELALAYANMSHLHMLVYDSANAVFWGGRAIELAERLEDVETLSYALNNVGAVELSTGHDGGEEKLERSLALALEHGFEEHVARAYANLADDMVKRRDYARAERYLRDGIAYCSERDLGSWMYCLRGHQARARLDHGDWSGAEEDATAILSVPWAGGSNRIPALLVLGLVRVRRGDPGVEAVLDEKRELDLAVGQPACVETAAARAEWQWLQGDRQACRDEALIGVQAAFNMNLPWFLGEAATWLWRGGGLSEAPAGLPLPFAVEIEGDWRAAAAEWERLGCPYEQALALLEGDEAAQRSALAIFEHLGAAPAAEIARQRLHAAGVRGLPRGPRPATRANPHGLTPRQLEILLLLAEGLHNTEIAERLSTTPKTVEHHVSAVLAKLEARSRAEAVRLAYERGLIAYAPSLPSTSKIGVR